VWNLRCWEGWASLDLTKVSRTIVIV
jgi:hypothetical protein